MKIISIGAGYVGTPTMAVFASKCPSHEFVVYDINAKLIEQWQSPTLPYYEKGLKPLIDATLNKNLTFTHDKSVAFKDADYLFVCVNTPTKTTGVGAGEAHDLYYVESVIRDIAEYYSENEMTKPITIVHKSTVPVGTVDLASQIFEAYQTSHPGNKNMYGVISNPEFMAEGVAVNDLLTPHRVILGAKKGCALSEKSVVQLEEIYSTWISKDKIIRTDSFVGELTKLASSKTTNYWIRLTHSQTVSWLRGSQVSTQ